MKFERAICLKERRFTGIDKALIMSLRRMIHNVSYTKHSSESNLTHWRVLQVLCYSGSPVDTLAVAPVLGVKADCKFAKLVVSSARVVLRKSECHFKMPLGQ
jgi:hypothetical protein